MQWIWAQSKALTLIFFDSICCQVMVTKTWMNAWEDLMEKKIDRNLSYHQNPHSGLSIAPRSAARSFSIKSYVHIYNCKAQPSKNVQLCSASWNQHKHLTITRQHSFWHPRARLLETEAQSNQLGLCCSVLAVAAEDNEHQTKISPEPCIAAWIAEQPQAAVYRSRQVPVSSLTHNLSKQWIHGTGRYHVVCSTHWNHVVPLGRKCFWTCIRDWIVW